MNSELDLKLLITSNGPYLEAPLACILSQSIGGTHSQDCIPEASAGEDGASGMVGAHEAGLNCCSSFKAFHRLTNIMLVSLCLQVVSSVGPTCPKMSPSLCQDSLQDRKIQFMREWVPGTTQVPCRCCQKQQWCQATFACRLLLWILYS